MIENASVSIVEVTAVVLLLAVALAPGVVTALKGHIALFVAGFFFGVVWIVAAFRLAKPNSLWARRFYASEKLERAQARYPKVDPDDPDRSKLALTVGFGLFAAVFLAGVVTGIAES